MRINVKAHPKSRRESVEQKPDGSYKVEVHAAPENGAANVAICELLAKHFGVPKSAVRVVLGGTSSRKVVEIDS